jgi:hypothetical protein
MADIKAGVLLSLKDQFSPGIKGAGVSVRDFSQTTLGAAEKVNKAFSGIAGTLGALGVTIGVGAAVKTYIDLDDRMVRIGTDIGMTAEKTNELKRSLYAVAQDPSIKMGTASLLEAMETFAGKNYDADFIKDNLRDIGLVMKATGATGSEAATYFIESFKRGMDKDEIMKSLDDISVIGDALHNQFSLADFTKSFSGLEATNTLLGKSAMSTTELFTAMNVLGAGTKSPARAVAAYTAIVNELADPKKQELLWNLGIAVREGGTGNFRNLADVVQEIAATDMGTGNFDTLSTVFSGAAMDAIFAYNQFGHLADGLEDLGDTSGEIERKAENNAKSITSNLQNLQTAFMGFADERLTKPLEKVTEFLNFMAEQPKIATAAMWGLTAAVGAFTVIKAGASLTTLIANLSKMKSGRIDLAGAAGGGAGIPVHVTNWGGGAGSSTTPGLQTMTPTGVPGLDPRAANAANFSGGAKKAGLITLGVTAVTQGVNAYRQVKAIDADTELSEREKGKAKGGVLGSSVGTTVGTGGGVLAGMLLAGKVGAMIGTAITPGLGTALGGAIGAIGGAAVGWVGGMLGKKVGEEVGDLAGSIAERRALREAVAKEDIPTILRDEINTVPQLPQGGGNPVLEGTARLENHVFIHQDSVEVESLVKNNSTPIEFPTGHAREALGGVL